MAKCGVKLIKKHKTKSCWACLNW